MTSANRTRIYQQMFKHPPYLFQVQFSHDKTNTPTTLDTLSPPIFFFSDLPIDRLERTTPTMASVATEVLTNHASAVGKYFGSVRVPASFIAGASFAGLFTVQIKEDGHGSSASRSLLSKYLSRAYHVCILIAFLLAINTVVVSTAANTMSLHDGSFNPMATSGYMVLKNEFEYEFIVTRWSFMVSLLSFLVATTHRILYEFQLFDKNDVMSLQNSRRMIGTAVCLLMSSLILHLVSFLNSTLICWDNLWSMSIDLFKVSVCLLLLLLLLSWKEGMQT